MSTVIFKGDLKLPNIDEVSITDHNILCCDQNNKVVYTSGITGTFTFNVVGNYLGFSSGILVGTTITLSTDGLLIYNDDTSEVKSSECISGTFGVANPQYLRFERGVLVEYSLA